MARMIKIPPIPTLNVHFGKGLLQFKIMSGCAYLPEFDAFTGGDWVDANLKTKDGEAVWIKLDGGELVIEKMTNYLVDESTGYMVGGKTVEVARFNICE